MQQKDSLTRFIGGAEVQFADGVVVSSVFLLSDFSAVRLDKLPRNSTAASVSRVLADLGINVPESNIRIPESAKTDCCSAEVKVQDPSFSKTLCSRLEPGGWVPFTSEQPSFEAVPIEVSTPQGTIPHRVDCNLVRCSWPRVMMTAVLYFGEPFIATAVSRGFRSSQYKVLGQAVTNSQPTGQAEGWNPPVWTVTLADVPSMATEQDIYDSIPEHRKPKYIMLDGSDHGAGILEASAIVRSMLSTFGPIEWWEPAGVTGSEATAQARFVAEADARRAVAGLCDAMLSFDAFSESLPLTVRLVTSAEIKVSERVYDAQFHDLKVYRQTWQKQDLRFGEGEPNRGYRLLRIEGEDSQDVARAKRTLSEIFAGVVARDGDKIVWSPTLANNNGREDGIRALEKSFQVVIVPDRRRAQVKVHGPARQCELAVQELVNFVKGEATKVERVVELGPAEFQWATKGGFKAVLARVGHRMATLDVISTPKRIIVKGTETIHAAVVAMVASAQEPASSGTYGPVSEAETCSICWSDAAEPVWLRCGHVYCTDCLANFCKSASSVEAIGFRARCVGDADRCGSVLTLDELQHSLPAHEFEECLETSFAEHVRRHPATYRYCPTPDCSQIYRVRATTESPGPAPVEAARCVCSFHTCPECLVRTCSGCHSSYSGMPLVEQEDRTRKLMEELRIQMCSKCRTRIEKIGGCNHVKCGACHAHICWQCLAVFDSSKDCYAHLREKHGGYADRQPRVP